MFGHLFSIYLCFPWSVNISRFMETVQCISSVPGFHLKIDAFFIHIQTMGLDIILDWKTLNYQKVILLNLKMILCARWPNFFYHKWYSVTQNFFSKQNTVVLRFEFVSDTQFSVQHQFLPPWSCCFFFKLSKYVNVVVLLLLFFSSYGHQCHCH